MPLLRRKIIQNEMEKAAGEKNEPALAHELQKPHEEKLAEIAANQGIEL